MNKHGTDRTRKLILILMLAAAALCIGASVLYANFNVTQVTVTGSTHYTDDEIKDMVLSGRLGHNSLFLKAKYRNRSVTGIPFIVWKRRSP